MALILRWTETWDGTDLAWSETWGDNGTFDLAPLAPVAMDGTLATTADIEFVLGAGYDLVALAAVAMTGTLSTAGDIGVRVPWDVEAPLEVSQLAGALSVAGDIEFVTAGTLNLQPLGPVAMAGALSALGDLQFVTPIYFDLAAAGAIGMAGSMSAAGDIGIGIAFNVTALEPVAMTGAGAISGDIQAVTPVPFNVQQSGLIAMAGELLASGDVQATVPFDLAAGTVAMSGVMGIAGDINAGGPFDLSGGEIALLAALGIAGNIQIRVPATVPDVTGLSREDAEAALQGAGFLVAVSLVLSTEVPVNHVISQDPAAGTASFVGTTVDIVVSQYDVAKVIGGNKNVRFAPLKKRRHEKEPETAAPRAKASGLLKGLLARLAPPELAAGLEIPPAPTLADAVAEAVAEVAPQPSIAVEEQEVSELEQLRQRVEALSRMVTEISGELQQLRQSHGPQALPALRDPLDDALVALLPAVREPIEVEPEEPAGLPELDDDDMADLGVQPAPQPVAAAPAADIKAENRRRAEILARRLL